MAFFLFLFKTNLMKKQIKILILIASITISKQVYSQALWIFILGDKVSTEKFQMGMNLSAASTWINQIDNSTNRITWAFGGFAEWKLNKHWSFQPEMIMKSPGGAHHLSGYELSPPLKEEDFKNIKTSIKLTYFSIPIYIKFKTKYIGFGLGPQFGLLYRATTVFEGEEILTGKHHEIKENIITHTNNFDYGLSTMFEYYLVPKKGLMSMRIGIKYYYGFGDISTNNNTNKNSTLLLTFAIPVGDETKTK